MKKSIAAPLLSAFVVPGLGQLINRQIAKGALVLGAVTALFVFIVFKVFYDFTQALNTIPDPQLNLELYQQVSQAMVQQSHTLLLVLTLLFTALWAYSVVDAYAVGKRIDRSES